MKKILVATVVGLALQVSGSEAQTSPTPEVSIKKQYAEPPPPPPPPPPAPVPPINLKSETSTVPTHAPAPPIPPEPPTPPTPPTPPNIETPPAPPTPYEPKPVSTKVLQDSVKMMIPENEKGFVLTVGRKNNASIITIYKKGIIVRRVPMADWLADSQRYEGLYGKLPPPPPPPPPTSQKAES